MAQDPDNPQEPPKEGAFQEPSEVERRTIREVIQAQHAVALREQEQERLAARRQEREERSQKRRKVREDRARQVHAHRVKALNEAKERVGAHVSDASRSLSAALRDLSETQAPRRTPEGREQQRMAQALLAAMGALRRVGRGTFHETDIDLAAEVDAL